jgi:hypothetical protein
MKIHIVMNAGSLMSDEVYVVILEEEDVYVFTSRQKAWDFIKSQNREYTILNAELVE